MSTDDIETHASSEGTDAGGAPLTRDITADTTPDGKPIYHGPDAWKRAAQEVAERTEADPDTFKSRGHEPRITADDIERGPVIKHHFKSKEPISVAEAARELVQQQELRKDPEYDRRINLLDKLVENGSDREEAEVDYRNAILEAEQRMAARRIGLYDEAPAEQQPEPAEQLAEPIQQQQPAQEPAQPGIRLPEIEAKAAQIAQQYIAEFGVQRALTSEEIATLTPEQAGRYQEYGQAVRMLGEQAQAQAILVQQARANEFQQYAAQQDALFEKAIPKGVDRAELTKAAVKYLQTDLGLSEQQLARMWHSDPQFRSATAQRLIMDAALRKLDLTKGEQARKQLNSKRAAVPPVQRGGGVRVVAPSGDALAAAAAAFAHAEKHGTQRQQIEAAARLTEAKQAAREQARDSGGRFTNRGFY